MAWTSLSVQWIVRMLCSATKKWKIKKNTLTLAVSIVNFKTSYFPAAWTSSQTGCKRPPKMARCTSVKAGSATSCCLHLPSLWPPGTQSGQWDPPSRFGLCSHRTTGQALALRSSAPSPPLLPTYFTEPTAWLSSPLWPPYVTVPVSRENFVVLGLSFVPSCSCFWQSI